MTDDASCVPGRPPDDPFEGRRQADELTAEELLANPVWWFPEAGRQLAGPDHATVLPVDASAASADGSVEFPPGRYLLRAEFVLADGTVATGHVTFAPGDDGSNAAREPTLVTPRGQLSLYVGALPRTRGHLDAELARVGLTRAAVFPLRWCAALHPPGAALEGSLDDFAAWRRPAR